MILSYLGNEQSESRLSKLLATKPSGTAISNAKHIQKLGYQVLIKTLTREEIETYLIENKPIIARIWTAMLDYWTITTSHVVVVVGFDDESVYVNDPSLPTAPKAIAWNAFLAAWAEYDEIAVVITRK
jgi:ABC-type bacteriocin/lantibiotic exporter with double-glycine peptidase domain